MANRSQPADHDKFSFFRILIRFLPVVFLTLYLLYMFNKKFYNPMKKLIVKITNFQHPMNTTVVTDTTH